MCFSALASFAGGAVLTAIGGVTVRQNHEPAQRLFAAIPFVFGLQQISEGFVWIALQSPGHDLMLKVATTLFLLAAVVIWPVLVPLAVLRMEKQKSRRILIMIFLGTGIATSLCYGTGMLIFKVTAQISSYHILYSAEAPSQLAVVTSITYLAATLLPLLVSSTKKIYLFGLVVALAYAVAQYFYAAYLVSVWCFFAAIASTVIWWIISEPVRQKSRSQKITA